MDAYDIALLMANQNSSHPLKMRFGSVVDAEENMLQVVPDGQKAAACVVKCCHPSIGDRVVILVAETEWLAVSVIGGDSALPRVGQLFITAIDEDPRDVWPGTEWNRLSDCSIFFSGNIGTAGNFIGENEHALSSEEMPTVIHFSGVNGDAAMTPGFGNYPVRIFQDYAENWTGHMNVAGGGRAHNNIQHSLVVNAWIRIS
ncbi:phage baseplate protein [Gordonibacter massiliensis (ex Traore et al. 2017)]|uniref:Baseplate structural protein Gp10 C-terminal domain-containing protein n=1 Tax=Gordonibacter massiliensis (ex Traore et al. 2017) TaxID=1841863 RepID=A0A842JH15_9ACTN|nr:hypothetical protein [Gordonibacter massiliensis (ex Traore et al. 2017)]MBC2888559.1 hypothetical protein [Gordonibacter massiliensis (ex Traore et al. 2017)]